jgi:osmoprotectant transport system substrate-binding protein
VAIGSPEGARDEVLGWLAAESLVAAGAHVADRIGMGDSRANREDQLAGLIDLYWEETGTGWTDLLREIGPSADPAELYEAVRDEDLEENGVVWLEPSPAETGLGVIVAPEVAEELGIEDLGDLAEALDEREDGVVICVRGSSPPLDPDGVPAIAAAADVRILPRTVTPVPDGQLVDLVEQGAFCPFGLIDRLAPDLEGAGVRYLDDDLGAFTVQNPAVTVREDTMTGLTGVEDLFAPISERLDTVTLRELVEDVEVDGADPREVAREWLVEEGLAEF